MIPSKGVDSTAKNSQTYWDLTSSTTGTVKRRPTSVESCKSISPTANEKFGLLDFPTDNRSNNAKDISASCRINKSSEKSDENTSKKNDLSQEVVENLAKEKVTKGRKKIDIQRAKKRFFDLKLAESAKKTFSSKLKLPDRVSLTLSPRKLSPNNKLSLSQLEQQNNLFIRDGQQQEPVKRNDNKSKTSELKKNKQEEPTMAENNIIFGSRKQNALPDIVMEKAESNNPKQKQDNLMGGKSKKSSLIPSFLGGSSKSANHIKILSTSGSIKKPPSTTQNVVEKLAKTGNKFKELYRDFPSSSDKATTPSTMKISLKRNPPPYRPPPVPPTQGKQNQLNVERQQKRIRFSENDARNYEEIDAISDENFDDGDGSKSTSNNDDISNTPKNNPDDVDKIAVETKKGELSKAEYSSNVFKNIPVRPRKGAVAHMDNYMTFDPSTDFTNEKELMKKKLMESRMPEINDIRAPTCSKSFQLNVENEESIEDVTFEDQTVYDVSERDEKEKSHAHHNYYEIDPDLLLEENECASEQVRIDRNQFMKENQCQSAASKNRKSKVYSNTLSTSSESTSTSQTSTNSSSTTTSSDYPSLFNSVIETTHSSNIESTDDNDSNGYGKLKISSEQTLPNSSQCGDTINQVNVTAVSNENVITISNVVTCGESNASAGAKKKSPQLNRIIRTSSTRNVSLPQQSNKQQTSSLTTKTKSTKTNLLSYNKTFDPLKSSHSLPQLENMTIQNRCRQQGGANKNDFNFVIDNTTTIQLRRQHNSHQGRPLSGQSDDRDSGFLSPVTPPDSQHPPAPITPNVIIRESEQNNKTETTLLNQCDNIQQLIEVSNSKGSCVTYDRYVFGQTCSLLSRTIKKGNSNGISLAPPPVLNARNIY